jgi:TM2 domain-containing membrane protein YozV
MENLCPQCGAPIDANSDKCQYCGASLSTKTNNTQTAAPSINTANVAATANKLLTSKNKTVAGILALLVGGLGVHKFYLGKTLAGILYLIFCWTYIPGILSFIEGILILTSSDEKFQAKYNVKVDK